MTASPLRFVLLRGLTREARHWGTFPQRLGQATGAADVQAIDLPGWGQNRAERSPSSIEATARAVMDKCADQVVVVGLSLGGMVAIEWARRAPEQVRGLVLISTSAGGTAPPWRRMRPGAFAALLPALAWRNGERRERRVLALTAARAGRGEQQAAALGASWAAIGREAAATWRWRALVQLLAAARYRAPRQAPTMPVLMLAGARDRLVDPRCAPPLAQRLGATLRVHPDAGHDLPLDDPDWILSEIEQWMFATQLSQFC